jgi:N,N'-diacetyllegionaminate synthase
VELLNLGGKLVGPQRPPYVIAEIGANHNGDMKLCRSMIDAARKCGSDAVKFQSWSRTSLISSAEYDRNPAYSDKKKHFGSLREMVEKYELTPANHREIAAYCRDSGITFLSTPFSEAEVELLVSLDVPALKIASMDVNNPRLLACAAQTNLPVILSTGMATMDEIEAAVGVLRQNGKGALALLHCISVYPPAPDNVHLRNIPMLAEVFDVPVGFSDHTMGTTIPLAAIAIGACIIEKHFTTDKSLPGWDHAISADAQELAVIVEEGRKVFEALGAADRSVGEAESLKRAAFRRSAVSARALSRGRVMSEGDITFKRPGTGIPPDKARDIVGKRLKRDVASDEELRWDDFE